MKHSTRLDLVILGYQKASRWNIAGTQARRHTRSCLSLGEKSNSFQGWNPIWKWCDSVLNSPLAFDQFGKHSIPRAFLRISYSSNIEGILGSSSSYLSLFWTRCWFERVKPLGPWEASLNLSILSFQISNLWVSTFPFKISRAHLVCDALFILDSLCGTWTHSPDHGCNLFAAPGLRWHTSSAIALGNPSRWRELCYPPTEALSFALTIQEFELLPQPACSFPLQIHLHLFSLVTLTARFA